MSINEVNQNDKKKDVLKWVVIGLFIFLIVVVIFGLGLWVGGNKARFSYRWAENYHKNFAGPPKGFLEDWRNFGGDDFISGHGTFGSIIKIDDNSLVVKGAGDLERVILITEATKIFSGRQEIQAADLKIDDKIVVIGPQNSQGQTEARLIRLFDFEKVEELPPPPSRGPFHPPF